MPEKAPGTAGEAYERNGPILCPVCRRTPLRKRQTVCGAACRASRWRQRRQASQEARDQEVRALLEAALVKLEAPGG